GAIISSLVIGWTVKFLDTPTPELAAQGIKHAIGEKFAAPQATLMATLIKGLLSFNLDWNFVLVGVFLAITVELCGVKSLSFAVGAYLPLSTTLPIFAGGAVKGIVEMFKRKKHEATEGDDELGKGNLFATGLVAGGALLGVLIAFLQAGDKTAVFMNSLSIENGLTGIFGGGGYQILGACFFLLMGVTLFRVARKK